MAKGEWNFLFSKKKTFVWVDVEVHNEAIHIFVT